MFVQRRSRLRLNDREFEILAAGIGLGAWYVMAAILLFALFSS